MKIKKKSITGWKMKNSHNIQWNKIYEQKRRRPFALNMATIGFAFYGRLFGSAGQSLGFWPACGSVFDGYFKVIWTIGRFILHNPPPTGLNTGLSQPPANRTFHFKQKLEQHANDVNPHCHSLFFLSFTHTHTHTMLICAVILSHSFSGQLTLE